MQENHANSKEESSSPRKAGGGCDRLKRDEWSEGAVSTLLEAYESKWVLRNRAKLKGQDWEEVARHVSSRVRVGSTKSPKTQTQCKNKIESMKKRYRSESAASGGGGDHASSWPLFSRLDQLMRGTAAGGLTLTSIAPSSPSVGLTKSTPLVLLESLPAPPQPPPPPPAPPPPPPPPCLLTLETSQNSPKSNGADQIEKEERVVGEEAKLSDQVSNRNKNAVSMDTDSSSTPALYGSKDTRSKLGNRMKKTERRKRRRLLGSSSREDMDLGIAQSIQLLAEAVVRSEQARMETLRDLERIRLEAEARRGEMDLKRTEMIVNTQLEIARIFAACASSAAKGADSCPGIAKNCT